MKPDTPPESVTDSNSQEQTQRLRLLRRTVVLWLVAFGLANLVLALYLISASVQNDITRAKADLDSIEESLIRISTPAPEAQELMTTLSQTLDLAGKLEAASPPRGVNWPIVMPVIGNY